MATIKNLKAREILDSRGQPTIEVDAYLSDGAWGRAAVPSGASTGVHEMLELRDSDDSRFEGQGVLKAVDNVTNKILPALKGQEAQDQENIDQIMINLDGTDNKSSLGANAILGVSMAVMKAAASSNKMPLFEWVGRLFSNDEFSLPEVMFNVLNGGKHADWATDVQEFFVIPQKKVIQDYPERLRAGAEIYQALKVVLKKEGYSITVGDEGGFAPSQVSSNTEAVELLLRAIEKSGYTAGKEVSLGFDAAASEFYHEGKYHLKKEKKELSAQEWVAVVEKWCEKYPITSLEDMLAEDDWSGWQLLMQKIGQTHQLVGDDLLVTNTKRIAEAKAKNACNSLLVKVNQIGSISETLAALRMTNQAGWTNVFSHRSGETEDVTIADLVVGTGSGQIKSGAPARGERTAKYNQLLRLHEQLSS